MAVTTIFTGNTVANTPTAWVAVPAASAYTVSVKGAPSVQYSIDGVNEFDLNSAEFKSISVTSPALPTLAYKISGVPILWARVLAPDVRAVSVTIANV